MLVRPIHGLVKSAFYSLTKLYLNIVLLICQWAFTQMTPSRLCKIHIKVCIFYIFLDWTCKNIFSNLAEFYRKFRICLLIKKKIGIYVFHGMILPHLDEWTCTWGIVLSCRLYFLNCCVEIHLTPRFVLLLTCLIYTEPFSFLNLHSKSTHPRN